MIDKKRLMPWKCPFCNRNHYEKDIYLVDIDGTLCEHAEPCGAKAFLSAKPLKERIKSIKKLKKQGHHIILQTGRPKSSEYETKEWLKQYKVPFDLLCFEKSGYIYGVDDNHLELGHIHVSKNKNDDIAHSI